MPASDMQSQAPAASRASAAFYETLVESLREGVAIVRDDTIVFANTALAGLTGRPQKTLFGACFYDLFAPADRAALGRFVAALKQGAKHDPHACRIVSAGNSLVPVHLNLSLSQPPDGEKSVIVSFRDISGQSRAEEALRGAERQFRSIFENAVEGIYQSTPDGTYLNVNPALATIYGFASTDDLRANLTDIAHQLYVNPADRDRFRSLLARDKIVRDFEAEVYHQNGSAIWITENARVVENEFGQTLYYEGTVEDITARKAAEEQMRLYAKVFEAASEAIIVSDTTGTIQAVNPAFERMTGWTRAEIEGTSKRFIHGSSATESLERTIFRTAIAGGGAWQGEIEALRRDGETFPAWLSVSGVRSDDGDVHTIVTLCSDLSQRKAIENRIRFQAEHDAVTHLVNRHMVMQRLDQAVTNARACGKSAIVIFLDLNRFKFVNDSFGHGAGDQMLRLAARRLLNCTRSCDTVGRVGGDEFVIILPNVENLLAGMAVVDKVMYTFTDPFPIANREIFSTPSMGIAIFPDDGETGQELIRNADAAMYAAKRGGGKRFRFFNQDMNQQAIERLTLENNLRAAMVKREFQLYYQPKIDLGTGDVVGAEALMRWHHPVLGFISPAIFIPVAEEAGLIPQLGEWALRQACEQFRLWHDDGIALPSISVNLSPAQFSDSNLVATIERVLDETGIAPGCLDLEITETMLAGEVERAIGVLNELAQLGVSLSLDDFGTGYSSLSYLKNFPVNVLKIDQSFVRELPGNAKDGAIVSSIMALAANLGFQVVAEGVETAAQARFLAERGCQTAQGYVFARPLAPPAFAAFMAGHDPADVLRLKWGGKK